MNRSEQSYAPIHINRHRMRSALELCHRLIGICQVDKSERSGSSVAGLILLSGVVVLRGAAIRRCAAFFTTAVAIRPAGR